MTTIVYRNGVMAADTQAYLGRGESGAARKSKIFKEPDGTLIGASSGCVGGTWFLLDWFRNGCKTPVEGVAPDSFEMLIVRPGGLITLYHDGFYPTHITAEFAAIGSGAAYALGAMSHGAGPELAVSIACEHDPFSGGEVEALSLTPGGQ